jgi:hypothetical protein
MPVKVNVHPDTGIAHYSATGDLTREEVITVIGQVYGDPAFRAPWHSIWDLTGAKPVFTADELRQVVAYVQDHRPEDAGRIAIVATEDLAFGMSRMYEIFSSDLKVETRVFRHLDPAQRWLLGGEAEPA